MRLALDVNLQSGHHDVFIHSVAANMMLIECDAALHVSDRLNISFEEVRTATVVWIGGRFMLCQFDGSSADDQNGCDRLPIVAAGNVIAQGFGTDAGAHNAEDAAMFGKRLQTLRCERGLKQSDIAKSLGVSTAAVSQWESGRMLPRGVRWSELAQCLGVSVTDLGGYHVATDLQRLIAVSRAEIARAAGIEPDRVRISLEM